ncbi:CUB and sushi domain-containing protein 3-like [Saccoglossus kowalevskii]
MAHANDLVPSSSLTFSSTLLCLLHMLRTISFTTGQCTDPGMPDNGYFSSPASPVFPVAVNATLEYACNAGNTMYGDDVITCTETIWSNQVPLCTNLDNIALGRHTANQSSASAWAVNANVGVDGEYEDYTQTEAEYEPSWYLDLEGRYEVYKVLIGCKEKDSKFYDRQIGSVIRIGFNKDLKSNTQCGPTIDASMFADRFTNPIILDCGGPITGRYISVVREGITGKLSLGELEALGTGMCELDPGMPSNGHRVSADPTLPVYIGGQALLYECDDGYSMYGSSEVKCVAGSTWSSLPLCTDLENVALNKPTVMSSISSPSKTSEKGVDGDLTNYFITQWSDQSWWMVDLAGLYEVSYVYIKNRIGGDYRKYVIMCKTVNFFYLI